MYTSKLNYIVPMGKENMGESILGFNKPINDCLQPDHCSLSTVAGKNDTITVIAMLFMVATLSIKNNCSFLQCKAIN